MLPIGPHFVERNVTHLCVMKEYKLFLSSLQLRPPCVEDAAALLFRPPHHKADRHARLDAKYIVSRAGQFRIGAHVAAQVENANFIELLFRYGAKAVEGAAFDETPIGDEREDA